MGPLNGVRIVDLCRYGPGRYCSMILADLGAEVITVEMPRTAGQTFGMMTDDTQPHYLGLNRNKKSIALNLKSDDGKEILYRLIEKVDVLLEGNRPGTMKRRGLDYDSVKKLNPRVIYCSVTGYGQDGPYAQRAGHDINFVGVAGILGLSGSKHGPPCYTVTPMIADVLGGTTQAVMAILAALYARDRTGKGQYIDVSSVDGAVFYHCVHAPQYFSEGTIPERATLPTGIDAAYMNVYKAKDGKYFTIGCLEPWHWQALCRVAGREEFVSDQFASIDRQKDMYEELSKVFATKTRDHWVQVLEEVDVSVAPVYDFDEMFSDTHLAERGVTVEVEHPRLGRSRLLNTPFKLSDTPAAVKTRPPLWAEHTTEVLQSLLGYEPKEVQRLRDVGAIE